jgi:hypothetical protein
MDTVAWTKEGHVADIGDLRYDRTVTDPFAAHFVVGGFADSLVGGMNNTLEMADAHRERIRQILLPRIRGGQA